MISSQAGSFLVLRGAMVIDGQSELPLKHGCVVIQGPTIQWMGPKKDLALPESAQVDTYDCSGKTILPGLVDVHTHTNMMGDGAALEESMDDSDDMLLLRSAQNVARHLATGVTTARENGARHHTAHSIKEGIRRGLIQGPRMLISGRPITITGGHCWPMGSEADGIQGVREAVRLQVKEGVDFIKVMTTGGGTRGTNSLLPSYTVDELKAITDEAHKFGRLVAMHATSTQGVKNALDAETDMIVHCMFNEPDGSYRYNPEIADRIAESGTQVNPTIYIGRSMLLKLEQKQREGAITSEERKRLEIWTVRHHQFMEGVGRLIEQGVNVVAGSDSGWGDYPLGEFQREIEMMAEVGMSNMQAIRSATSQAARSIGLDKTVGLLKPGMQADIIVVDGDPMGEIKALANITAVFKSGKLVLKPSN